MIGNMLGKEITKRLSSLGIKPDEGIESYYSKDTLKKYLLDDTEDHEIILDNDSKIIINLNIEGYSKALFTDYFFGVKRIESQQQSINALLAQDCQVAWIVVSVYYYNFFVSNELSKLYGRFIINFSQSDIRNIIGKSNNSSDRSIYEKINEGYTSYLVEVDTLITDSIIKLKLTKHSRSKPHQIVWINLAFILDNLKNDSLHQQPKDIFRDMLEGSRNWDYPSKVRNDWNYKYVENYFNHGTTIGSTFLKLMNNSRSAFSWINRRNIQPTEENKVASIAYLYEELTECHNYLVNRFGF